VGIEWNNYSTSFIGDIAKTPLLMAAIPYNGIYGDIEAGENDIHLRTGLFDFKANPVHRTRVLYTYDSTDVYFLAPGIFKSNADKYEFRIYANAGEEIVPWSRVDRFTESSFVLINLERGMAFLGGYRADWGQYVTAELRASDTKKIISAERVLWKEARPAISAIFTAPGLTDFLLKTKSGLEGQLDFGNAPRTSDTLTPENNELIVFMAADIYKKAALEYRVIRDGKQIRQWGQNEFDNNAIRLKDLDPGRYALEVRYRRQRQNIKTYTFWKAPFWYQRGGVRLAAAALVVAFGVLLSRLIVLRRQKKALTESNRKMSAISSELRYVQSQLNPHFIFNALSSIQGLINSGETGRANEYLGEFGSLLRDTLAGDEKGMAPLAVELKMLRRYLKLEQLRFNFTSEVSVDSSLNESEVAFPVLLLQPLVENAVKHGVAGMEGKGRIVVTIRKEKGDMEVDVADNGRGFPAMAGLTAGESDAGKGHGPGKASFGAGVVYQGLGLKLTRDRIDLINQSNPGQQVGMRIESSPGKGTIVFLRFKNWLA
jgi:anti-sigma regulatory factor (Ser/Thr protein kinase)